MQITNDNIYIVRGETPTHNRSVIDKDTGVPYIIPDGINNPYIEFTVRPSLYDKKDNYVFKAYLDCSNVKRFSQREPLDYNEPNTDVFEWTDDVVGETDRLYRKFYMGDISYRYYDPEKEYVEKDGSKSHWHPYSFSIHFSFPYADGQVRKGEEDILKFGGTSAMEAKKYKYSITLIAGIKKDNIKHGESPLIIDFTEPILKSADFIVEGSTSE